MAPKLPTSKLQLIRDIIGNQSLTTFQIAEETEYSKIWWKWWLNAGLIYTDTQWHIENYPKFPYLTNLAQQFPWFVFLKKGSILRFSSGCNYRLCMHIRGCNSKPRVKGVTILISELSSVSGETMLCWGKAGCWILNFSPRINWLRSKELS